MDGDLPGPEASSPDQPAAQPGKGPAKRQVVDWFALTEDNLPPPDDPPAPSEEPTLEVPSACSIGGLRP